jgi:hypothetical protein
MTRLIAIALFFVLSCPGLDVAWADADRVLRNRIIRVELRSGEIVEGLWLSSDADSFTLETDRQGPKQMPRNGFRRAWFRKKQVRSRVIGTIAGYAGGAGLATAINRSGEALQGPLFFLPIGLGALGFFTGREIDRQPEVLTFQ